ncbi:MAG TPA: hypothetical protein VKV33_00900 [Streptosporangiaceae bacterium]|nr:hypothetical protein [Streptosporangiaceae bacterium]
MSTGTSPRTASRVLGQPGPRPAGFPASRVPRWQHRLGQLGRPGFSGGSAGRVTSMSTVMR